MDLKDIGKCCLILALIAAFSGGLIATTYGMTDPIITERAAQAAKDAAQSALPQADSFEQLSLTVDNKEIKYFIGKASGQVVGYAVETIRSGYKPDLSIITGISAEGVVLSVNIVGHSETSGIGTKVFESETFMNALLGKSISDPLKLGSDLDAISGATMTSRGVSDSVRAALDYYQLIVSAGP